MLRHPAVREVVVIGAPSHDRGATLLEFVTLRAGEAVTGEAARAFANATLGKTQRLHEAHAGRVAAQRDR